MAKGITKAMRALILFSFLSCLFPPSAMCRIVVHDIVVPISERTFLQAETRGRFFHKGGELVEFFVDGVSLGKTLSGGDGMAYKPFTPNRTRLYQIEVRSAKEMASGRLLALESGSALFLVEVKNALMENPILRHPRSGSHHALERIGTLFPVVFLQTGIMGIETTKGWLQKHTFSKSLVIPWDGGNVIDDMAEKGMKIKALVSGGQLVESAYGRAQRIFSFEEAENATEVQSWQEVLDGLLADPIKK